MKQSLKLFLVFLILGLSSCKKGKYTPLRNSSISNEHAGSYAGTPSAYPTSGGDGATTPSLSPAPPSTPGDPLPSPSTPSHGGTTPSTPTTPTTPIAPAPATPAAIPPALPEEEGTDVEIKPESHIKVEPDSDKMSLNKGLQSKEDFLKFAMGCFSVNSSVNCLINQVKGFFKDGFGGDVESLKDMAGTIAKEGARASVSGMPGGAYVLRALGIKSTQDQIREAVVKYGPNAVEILKGIYKFHTDPEYQQEITKKIIEGIMSLAGLAQKAIAGVGQMTCDEIKQKICRIAGMLSYEVATIIIPAVLTLPAGGAGGGAKLALTLTKLSQKSPALKAFIIDSVEILSDGSKFDPKAPRKLLPGPDDSLSGMKRAVGTDGNVANSPDGAPQTKQLSPGSTIENDPTGGPPTINLGPDDVVELDEPGHASLPGNPNKGIETPTEKSPPKVNSPPVRTFHEGVDPVAHLNLMNRHGLSPKDRIMVGSTPYKVGDVFDIEGGRLGAFFEVEVEGQKFLRFAYRSNSQGSFRVMPAQNNRIQGVPGYDKGLGEEGLNVPIELEEALVAKIPSAKKGLPSGELVRGGMRVNNSSDDYRAYYNSPEHIKNHQKKVPFLSSAKKEKVRMDLGEKMHPSDIRVSNPLDRPDFSSPIRSFDSTTAAAGKVKAQVFKSRNNAWEYTVFEDRDGKIWFSSVLKVDSPINRFGVRSQMADLFDLITPRWDYTQQTPYGYGGAINPNLKEYQDNWKYLKEIPEIQEYYRAQNKSMPD